MRNSISWKDAKNLKILKSIYPDGGYREIQKYFPNSSKRSIVEAARREGIKCNNPFGHLNKLKILLEDNNFNYYWIGFLMADGSYDDCSGRNRMRLSVTIKDEGHIKILADYLKAKMYYVKEHNFGKYKCNSSCSISITDINGIKQLKSKYGFINNKTENPPNLNWIDTKEKFLSFLCGFIDGDGCIAKTNNLAHMIRIQCHKNWIEVFNFFSTELEKYLQIKSKTYIDNTNYSHFLICRFNQLKVLKQEIILLKIPFLQRKWNLIDETIICNQNIEPARIQEALLMFNSGFSFKAIGEKIKCSANIVSKIIKNNHGIQNRISAN